MGVLAAALAGAALLRASARYPTTLWLHVQSGVIVLSRAPGGRPAEIFAMGWVSSGLTPVIKTPQGSWVSTTDNITTIDVVVGPSWFDEVFRSDRTFAAEMRYHATGATKDVPVAGRTRTWHEFRRGARLPGSE